MVVIVAAHAHSPAAVSTDVLSPMTYILAGASGVCTVLALLYTLLCYPKHRGTVLVLALLVLGVFAAHLYTINNPSASVSDSVSSSIDSAIKDDHITLTSSLTGTQLNAVVTASGSDAIGGLSLTLGNVNLPDSGFAREPNYTDPLQPGGQVQGSWTLSSPPTGQLTLTYQDMTCYDTSKQADGCAMDEVYYVPSAQTMLSGERCAPYQDNCNVEHPFLNKAFIAAGIAIFGNDTFGWRIINVIIGTFSIALLFGVCWVTTKNARLSVYAAFLLAFETLFFVHSSIAVIDVGAIFFGLLGFFFYFAKLSWWKLNSIALAGISLGLAALCKETAIWLFLILVFYNLLYGPGFRRDVAKSTSLLVVSTGLVFIAGLQVYDSLMGAGVATTFLGQIDFILRYGSGLKVTPSLQACLFHFKPNDSGYSCGWIDSILNAPITPLNWITYYSPVGYLVTNVSVSSPTAHYSYISVGYYGITNQFEVWFLYFWVAYVVYLWWKTGGKNFVSESVALDWRLARFAMLWVAIVFFGYLLYGRVTYPYYFIEAVPALCIGGGYLLSRAWFPNGVAYVFLAGIFIWWFIFYPDKSFLPTQVRVWIGH
jgi:4-amino-4-deoxy-L-arabinose transferase-like glycosyltransferase